MLSELDEELVMVSDLIDHNTMEWRYDLIEENFSERDKRCILAIPLSWRQPHDEITWAYSKKGTYSVKTSYMLGKGMNFENLHAP